MRITLDPGAFTPLRAHDTDAGLDLFTREDVEIQPGGTAVFDTGVHIELPKGTFGKLESKSGLHVNYDVVCLGGVIDEGYTGSICVKLHNFGKDPYRFLRGEKIVQLIIQPYFAEYLEIVKALTKTERGNSGFGSTGR